MYRKLIAPVSIQIELTEACNNSCLYCYNHWRLDNDRVKFFPVSQVEKICREIKENNIFSVNITGGEPLMNKEGLIQMVRSLKKYGVEIGLNSNLRLLTKEYAKELYNHGVRNVLTSMLSYDDNEFDSLAQRNGAFKETVDGVKNAMDAGIRVSANMVLTKRNFGSLYKTAEFIHELGIRHFSATKVSPSTDLRNISNLLLSKEDIESSLETLMDIEENIGLEVDILECYPLCLIKDGARYSKFVKKSCSAGINSFVIAATGEVRPCPHAHLIYGNAFEEHLSEIWDRMDDWRKGQYLPQKCLDCRYLMQCSGGCRTDAYSIKGAMDEMDPNTRPERIDEITLSKPKEINEDETFIAPLFKFRVENQGYYIYGGGTSFYVNPDGFEMLKTIMGKEITVNNFKGYEVNFIKNLIHMNFLKKKIC